MLSDNFAHNNEAQNVEVTYDCNQHDSSGIHIRIEELVSDKSVNDTDEHRDAECEINEGYQVIDNTINFDKSQLDEREQDENKTCPGGSQDANAMFEEYEYCEDVINIILEPLIKRQHDKNKAKEVIDSALDFFPHFNPCCRIGKSDEDDEEAFVRNLLSGRETDSFPNGSNISGHNSKNSFCEIDVPISFLGKPSYLRGYCKKHGLSDLTGSLLRLDKSPKLKVTPKLPTQDNVTDVREQYLVRVKSIPKKILFIFNAKDRNTETESISSDDSNLQTNPNDKENHQNHQKGVTNKFCTVIPKKYGEENGESYALKDKRKDQLESTNHLRFLTTACAEIPSSGSENWTFGYRDCTQRSKYSKDTQEDQNFQYFPLSDEENLETESSICDANQHFFVNIENTGEKDNPRTNEYDREKQLTETNSKTTLGISTNNNIVSDLSQLSDEILFEKIELCEYSHNEIDSSNTSLLPSKARKNKTISSDKSHNNQENFDSTATVDSTTSTDSNSSANSTTSSGASTIADSNASADPTAGEAQTSKTVKETVEVEKPCIQPPKSAIKGLCTSSSKDGDFCLRELTCVKQQSQHKIQKSEENVHNIYESRFQWKTDKHYSEDNIKSIEIQENTKITDTAQCQSDATEILRLWLEEHDKRKNSIANTLDTESTIISVQPTNNKEGKIDFQNIFISIISIGEPLNIDKLKEQQKLSSENIKRVLTELQLPAKAIRLLEYRHQEQLTHKVSDVDTKLTSFEADSRTETQKGTREKDKNPYKAMAPPPIVTPSCVRKYPACPNQKEKETTATSYSFTNLKYPCEDEEGAEDEKCCEEKPKPNESSCFQLPSYKSVTSLINKSADINLGDPCPTKSEKQESKKKDNEKNKVCSYEFLEKDEKSEKEEKEPCNKNPNKENECKEENESKKENKAAEKKSQETNVAINLIDVCNSECLKSQNALSSDIEETLSVSCKTQDQSVTFICKKIKSCASNEILYDCEVDTTVPAVMDDGLGGLNLGQMSMLCENVNDDETTAIGKHSKAINMLKFVYLDITNNLSKKVSTFFQASGAEGLKDSAEDLANKCVELSKHENVAKVKKGVECITNGTIEGFKSMGSKSKEVFENIKCKTSTILTVADDPPGPPDDCDCPDKPMKNHKRCKPKTCPTPKKVHMKGSTILDDNDDPPDTCHDKTNKKCRSKTPTPKQIAHDHEKCRCRETNQIGPQQKSSAEIFNEFCEDTKTLVQAKYEEFICKGKRLLGLTKEPCTRPLCRINPKPKPKHTEMIIEDKDQEIVVPNFRFSLFNKSGDDDTCPEQPLGILIKVKSSIDSVTSSMSNASTVLKVDSLDEESCSEIQFDEPAPKQFQEPTKDIPFYSAKPVVSLFQSITEGLSNFFKPWPEIKLQNLKQDSTIRREDSEISID